MDKFMDNATVFFTKTTNRELFKHRNVMEYQDGRYVLTNPTIFDVTLLTVTMLFSIVHPSPVNTAPSSVYPVFGVIVNVSLSL